MSIYFCIAQPYSWNKLVDTNWSSIKKNVSLILTTILMLLPSLKLKSTHQLQKPGHQFVVNIMLMIEEEV